MIKFVGYNDARAIRAFNKKNLTVFFIWLGVICFVMSIIAVVIPTYELLLIVWGLYLFFAALCFFAMSFGKYEDKAFKENDIRTKHHFEIFDLKLYRDGKEIKDTKQIKIFSHKTYILLELKRSYYYVPLEESTVSKEILTNAIYEVIFQVSIAQVIDEVKTFVENNELNGEFTLGTDSIVWVIGDYKYTYHIDLHEVYVIKDKLTFDRIYRNITHYHILTSEVIENIKEINQEYIS